MSTRYFFFTLGLSLLLFSCASNSCADFKKADLRTIHEKAFELGMSSVEENDNNAISELLKKTEFSSYSLIDEYDIPSLKHDSMALFIARENPSNLIMYNYAKRAKQIGNIYVPEDGFSRTQFSSRWYCVKLED